MSPRPVASASPRPVVSVIVPFAGSDEQLRACLVRLGRLSLADGDEVLVADNRPGAFAATEGVVRILPAPGVRAAGFARNCAAAVAVGEWLVFIDADTRPDAALLERYFDPEPGARTGILAGGIADVPGGPGPAARHAAARRQLSQQVTLRRPGTPYVQSANMAVRRTAFAAVGGFDDRARSGEDADVCFRLAGAGWELEERALALVEHLTRPTLRGLMAQLARHGSGAAWCNRRHPGEFPPPRVTSLAARVARSVGRAAAAAASGRPGPAREALLEALEACAFEAGRLLPNRARSR
jgi:hypothetical protein